MNDKRRDESIGRLAGHWSLVSRFSSLALSLRLRRGGRRGRGQRERLYFRLERALFVAAIAKGLVLRMTAAAKGDHRPPGQIEWAAVLVHHYEFPFNAKRAVIPDRDFGFGQI